MDAVARQNCPTSASRVNCGRSMRTVMFTIVLMRVIVRMVVMGMSMRAVLVPVMPQFGFVEQKEEDQADQQGHK